MPDKGAATLNRAAVRAFKPIPEGMRNTLTLDNGKEFAAHKELSQAVGIDTYFAHPYRPWERGLIRQYLPKKEPFDTPTQKQLDKIVDKINNRVVQKLQFLNNNRLKTAKCGAFCKTCSRTNRVLEQV
jgi:IS30 family transposase